MEPEAVKNARRMLSNARREIIRAANAASLEASRVQRMRGVINQKVTFLSDTGGTITTVTVNRINRDAEFTRIGSLAEVRDKHRARLDERRAQEDRQRAVQETADKQRIRAEAKLLTEEVQ